MSEEQITIINSKKEYDDLVSSTSDGLIVVDFYADWCGPCRQIAPVYKRFSKEFKKVKFASVDVDEHEIQIDSLEEVYGPQFQSYAVNLKQSYKDIAENEGVTVMPVFRFYKLGQMIDQVTGANKEQLREKLEMYQ